MIVLVTPDQTLYHEAEEMLRLFFGMEQIRPEGDGGESHIFCVTAAKKDGAWVATACGKRSGEAELRSQSIMNASTDPLEDKRSRNRAVKFALFNVLSEIIPDKRPVWGALTGIRPSKLLYEMMNSLGVMPEESANILVEKYGVRRDKADILLDIESMQRGLRGKEPSRLVDVYIGIPFCPTRCVYCSFVSTDVRHSGHLRDPYVAALVREIALTRELMAEHGIEASTVYIGGGTPTTLEPHQLEQVLAAAETFVPESGEFTLEAGRPDTMTREKLELARKYGVTRVSVNPQSMNDITLERIGRKHSSDDIRKAYALARDIGFDSINMDLIAGLTGETCEMFERSLCEVIALAPENITVHTLSIKRSSALHEHIADHDISTASSVERMVDISRSRLSAAGWLPYYLYRQKYMTGNLENTGFALPGTQCLYNIDVMEETHGNIAMGAGAITKWFYPETNLIKRAANVKNVEQYIERVDEMVQRKKELAEEIHTL